MDASSTRRARLTRLALCTGAVAAVAAFTGEARADNGLSGLVSGVSGTVSGTVEQLPAPVAEPLAEVVSSVTPTVDAAVPPAVEGVVEDVTQLPGEIVAPPAVPGMREQEVPAGGGPNGSGVSPEATPRASSTPEVAASAEEPAPIAVEAAAASAAESARGHAVPVSRPSSDLTPAAKRAAPARRPSVSAPRTLFSPVHGPVSRDVAPDRPITTITAAESPAHRSQAPASPLPAGTELPGFDALLPPLAAFALLLALPLGLFALTAPRALGAGPHPAVAVLRSADVRFRLVRPG